MLLKYTRYTQSAPSKQWFHIKPVIDFMISEMF